MPGDVHNASLEDTLSLAEVAAGEIETPGSTSDTLTLTEVAAGTITGITPGAPRIYDVSISDSLSLTEQLNTVIPFSLSDFLDITDQPKRVIDGAASDSVSFTDDPYRTYTADDDLVITDVASENFGQLVTDTLVFTESLAVEQHISINVADTLVFTDGGTRIRLTLTPGAQYTGPGVPL